MPGPIPDNDDGANSLASLMPLLRGVLGAGSLAALIALLFLPAFAPWVLRFEHWTADWRTAYLSEQARTQHARIAFVSITDETLRNYASSPVDRGLLARIVQAIDAAGASAIGLDILFLKATEPAKDQALVDAVRAARAVVVLGVADDRVPLEGFQRDFQQEYLARLGRPAGYLNLRHERDDVVRYSALPSQSGVHTRSFPRLLAAAVGVDSNDTGRAIPWLVPSGDSPSPFLTIPAQNVLADPTIAASLKDRIVIVGGDFPLRDRHRTPLTLLKGEDMAGAIIHAQVLAGMLDKARGLNELEPITVRVLLVLLGAAGFALGWLLFASSIVHLIGWSFATAVLVAIDAFLFVQVRLLLPFTLALLAWFLGVTAGRSLRVLGEKFMKRRDIQ